MGAMRPFDVVSLPLRPRRSRRGRRDRSAIGQEQLESRALLAVTAQLVGGSLSIQLGAAKDLATITAYETSYSVTGTGMTAQTFSKSAVQSIKVADAGAGHTSQSLLIGGSSPVSQPLSVTGIESTVLNTDVAITSGKGSVSFGGPVTLGKGQSIDISNAVGGVVFGSTLNGAALLKIDAPNGEILFKGQVGKTTPLARLSFPAAGAVNALASLAVQGSGQALLSGISFGSGVKQVSMGATGSSVKGFGTGISIEASPAGDAYSRRLKNFTISGNGVGVDFLYAGGQKAATASFAHWNLSANRIADNAAHGIRFSADTTGRGPAGAVVIDQNAILGNKRDGIRVEGRPGGLVIQNNMLADNAVGADDAVIRLTDGLGIAGDLRISGNTIGWSNSKSTGAGTAIVAKNLPGLTIVNNTINNYATGISLTGDFTRPSGFNVLAGNTVTGASTVGVSLVSATNVVATDNRVSGSWVGIQASGKCTGTVVSGGSLHGYSALGLSNAGGITIENAKVNSSINGIFVSGDSPGTVIKSPTITDTPVGIALSAAKGVSIQSPAISKSVNGVGIFNIPVIGTAFVAEGDCTGSSVVGGSFNGTYGIKIGSVTGLSVSKGAAGFTVPNCAVAGVYVSGACPKTSLVDGLVSDGKGDGIVLEAAQGVTLQGMTSKMNAGQGLKATGDLANSRVLKGVFTSNTNGISLTAAKNLLVGDGTIVRWNTKAGLAASGLCVGTSASSCDLTGNGTGVFLDSAQGILVAQNTVTGNKVSGVQAKGACAASVLAANSIESSSGNGVVLSSATGLQINDGDIGGHDLSGVYAEGNCAGTSFSGVVVEFNEQQGIVLSAAKGLSFTGTKVQDNWVHGLLATGDCAGSKVSGASFTGNKSVGAVLSSVRGLAFTGSTFSGNAVHGLSATGDCTGSSVNGATIEKNGQVGVVLNVARGLAITASTMAVNTAHGLQALGVCTGSAVTGSTISGNKQMGVVLSGAQGLTVNAANKIDGNAGNGLYADNLCTGTKVGGNTITKNGNAGVFLSAAKGISVINNTVTDNVKFGLNASGLSTGTTVLGNTFSGSAKNLVVTATGGTFQQA